MESELSQLLAEFEDALTSRRGLGAYSRWALETATSAAKSGCVEAKLVMKIPRDGDRIELEFEVSNPRTEKAS